MSGSRFSHFARGKEFDTRYARRGQTLPDFVVGITIFLITFTFVVQFVPQMILPFEGQEQSVVAQRAASGLGNHLLADGETPSKLNEACTLAFFEQISGESCPFDTDNTVTDQLGISPTYAVNVTLRDTPSGVPGSATLCAVNGSISDCETDATRLAVGSSVSSNDRSVAVALRRVFVEGTEAVIEVKVG